MNKIIMVKLLLTNFDSNYWIQQLTIPHLSIIPTFKIMLQIILQCVCSLCSLNKAYLPYDEEELKRVCDICYEECKKQGNIIINYFY